MKVLLSALQRYIDLVETPEELSHILTQAGLEVDKIESFEPQFKGVVVAKIQSVRPHPNADSLRLATIFDGNEEIELVCGAPNCREGIYVAFAKEGAELFASAMKIGRATIRGVESCGMLCGEDELGLTQKESAGILELDGVKEGESFDDYVRDVAFEISLTPNLGHCLSVYGIARELAGLLRRPLKPLTLPQIEKKPSEYTIKVIDQDVCPRYSALVVKNVRNELSPFSLKLYMKRSGLNSVSSLVDCSNVVMHELGQPLHFFDGDKVIGKELIIEKAKGTEEIVCLDETHHRCPEGTIIIRDKEKVCALGGVMGDLHSSVSDTTTSLLVEAAFFDPRSIRKTKRALNMQTESAKRFERGCDIESTLTGLAATFEIMQKYNKDASIEGFEDILEAAIEHKSISVRRSRASSILGFEVGAKMIEETFQSLSFPIVWDKNDLFTVSVPPHRHDLNQEIDLIEEIYRMNQHEYSEHLAPAPYVACPLENSQQFEYRREARRRMLQQGLQEIVTTSLIDPDQVLSLSQEEWKQESLVIVQNPTSKEQSLLRPTLLFNFLDVAKRNVCQQTFSFQSFEVGQVHFKKEDKYIEQTLVGAMLFGDRHRSHFSKPGEKSDFFDIKGIGENLLSSFGIQNAEYVLSKSPLFHPKKQAHIFVEGLQIGSLGQLSPSLLRSFDIDAPLFFMEINLNDLIELPKKKLQFAPLPAFPSSERDWTITVKEEVTYKDILEAIYSVEIPILEKVEFLSVFRHEKVGEGMKNMTFRFVFRSSEGTVKQKEVDAAFAQIQEKTSRSIV